MWSTAKPLWRHLIMRQLHFDSRGRLQVNVGKPIKSTTVIRNRFPENTDIILEEDELTKQELQSKNPVALKVRKISEVLECDSRELGAILKDHPEITSKPLTRLLWTARLLKVRYPTENILCYPSVLNLSWRLLEHRRRVLEEIAAENIEPISSLVLFERMCALSLFELNRRRVISSANLLPLLLSKIEDCPQRLRKRLLRLLSGPAVSALSLLEYRGIIIREYLKATIGDINLPKTRLRLLEKQSIELISVRVNILLKELSLDPNFLRTQPNLLLVNTHNLRDIVDRVDFLSSVPLRDMATRNPKILAMSAKRLCDVEKILRSQNAHSYQLEKLPNIYNVHPQLFKEQFMTRTADVEAMPPTEEPAVMMRMLHYQDILKRIATIERQSNKRALDDPDRRISQGWQSPMENIIDFLVLKLKADGRRAQIKKCLSAHPLKKILNVAKCNEVCDFLEENNILSKAQIAHNVSIVFWSKASIQRVWDVFPKEVYAKALGPDWKSHPFLAEMLMYEMENEGLSILPKSEMTHVEPSKSNIWTDIEQMDIEDFDDEDDADDDDDADEGKKVDVEDGNHHQTSCQLRDS